MKSVFKMAAMAAGMFLVASAASAADYQGIAGTNNGRLLVTWHYDLSSCIAEYQNQIDDGDAVNITVNNDPYSALVDYTHRANDGITGAPFTSLYLDSPSPYVPLQSATLQNGRDYVSCGADRLLFPGATSQPTVAIPTLTEWAMILFGMMLAAGAALTIQRRRTA